MAGGFRIAIDRQPAGASSAGGGGDWSADGVQPIFVHGHVRLWSDEPVILVDPRTVIIGHLFTRGPPSRRVTSLSGFSGAQLMADRGRLLLDRYWGGYVVLHIESERRAAVLRDPSGILPCYVRGEACRVTCAGDITDLARPARRQVDFGEVARMLASGDARGRRTCLHGIEELVAGECMIVEPGGISLESWWLPWNHVVPTHRMDVSETAEALRDTIADCVGAWSGCFSSILLGLSGGLDSSIVAVTAAPRSQRLTCLTLFGPDADGDERRYAGEVAGGSGLELRAEARNLDDVDIRRAPAPHHPWPVAPLFKQTNAAIHGRLQHELPIDAHFSGNGGDGIFSSMHSAVPLIDRLLAKGPGPGFAATLDDICTLTGADRSTVLRHAWTRYRRERGRHILRYNTSGLMPDVAEQIETAGPAHPWLAAPAGVLPGKTVHAAYLMRAQKGFELYSRAHAPPHIAPLHSQPIVELCLSIQSWAWISGGRDRAIARRAFEGRLPARITSRTGKGGPGAFGLSIYERHRDALHDHLRGGVLAASNILDLGLLDAPEDPSWRGTTRIQRILALAAAENWARWWSGA